MATWWERIRLGRRALRLGSADLTLVHNKNFSRLWSAQILSQIAQQLLNFALIVRVFDLAQGTRLANISVALVVLSFGVPSIFFAAAAGVYVDHWNRKVVLVTANIIRGLLVLGYLVVERNLVLVLILTFIISATTQFFAPAEAASIPVLVNKRQLLRANSLFVFTMYASFIVGYGLASPVIALLGSSSQYFLTSLMFLFAALLVVRLPSMRAVTHTQVRFQQLLASTWHEIFQNWHIIRKNRNLSFPILQLTISQAMVGVVLALAPALSLVVLHRQIQSASQFLIIPAGLGMVIGVVVIGELARRFSKITIITRGMAIAAGALLALGIVGIIEQALYLHYPYDDVSLPMIVALFVALLVFILGLMNGLLSITAQTLLQEHTTDASRGKIFGALNMMINIAGTLPILFAGILADLVGVTRVITILGATLLIFGIAQIYWLRRQKWLTV